MIQMTTCPASQGDLIDEEDLDDNDAFDKCCDYAADKNEHRKP